MRILWLCNIMLPVIAEHLNREGSNKEGWLSGLADVILTRQQENGIELHVAFPVEKRLDGYAEQIKTKTGTIHCYGFYEDVDRAERYDSSLEVRLRRIIDRVQPDVIHCFGTEYGHTLAAVKCAPHPEKVLVGIQGVCSVIARAYMAELPKEIQRSRSLRDILKRDSMAEQQQKFALRGAREDKLLRKAVNVTGRTDFDRLHVKQLNPGAEYFAMNETLRPCFYEGEWDLQKCEKHSIFISQGDYPLKGLHYLLLAAAKLREKYPDLKICVAGNSLVRYETLKDRIKISAYGKYLRRLIQEAKLESCVQFLGRLSATEMKEQYLKSHLFVCCSANENSPNSLGEAMILGVPCVAAAVGGIPSLFTADVDGILYPGYEANQNINNTRDAENNGLYQNAEALYHAICQMWDHPEEIHNFCKNARKHAEKNHNREENYQKMMEIYATIARKHVAKISFVSNYINHHQIPFCNAMSEATGGQFTFIQTQPMEEERIRMGWQETNQESYVRYYYKEEALCRQLIRESDIVLFGGCDDESYIEERLQEGKPIIRISERLYKTGQWKAVSPKGLKKKYHDHTRYRNARVYLLCAGAYVPSDFHIVRAYPQKMFCWGYFPETKHYDVDKLLEKKGYPQGAEKIPYLLWAARFIDLKHPKLPLQTAKYLKEQGLRFHMDIVGGGAMEGEVQSRLREYALEDCVTLVGYLTPAEVRKRMEKADIYLLTSDRQEGWGAVANEAMNSGCALVANHMVGAAPYLVRQGYNGFVYRDGNAQMLYETVEKLVKDNQLCRELGRHAYETVTEVWNAENAARHLLELIEKVVLPGGKAEAVPDTMEELYPCAPAPVISERRMWKELQLP